MIDDIEEILSKEVSQWTEEEKIRILGPRDTYTKMKCTKCGYEESVSDWVLSEFQDMDKQKEISTECPKCNASMFKKK